MLMEGNEGTFCVTLNNRELKSLDEVLLSSPKTLLFHRAKFLSSIHHYHYPHLQCARDLKNPPFGNAVPESLYQTAVLCISKRSLMEIGQRSSCEPQNLGHPAADGRVISNAAICCCRGYSTRHVD